MPIKRKFNFPIATLLYESDQVMTAAEARQAFATKRLKEGLLNDSRRTWTNLGGAGGGAGQNKSAIGRLTKQQNDAIVAMLDLFGRAKDSAKRAFGGDKVKLREEFQVGINEPRTLASILSRCRKVRDACQVEANTGPLKDKGGWIADDTAALDAAITTVGQIDKEQLASIVVEIAGTDARNNAANTLFDDTLTIQNAANIEWPERNPQNRSVRESFRFGIFPPRSSRPARNQQPAGEGNGGGNAPPTPSN